MAQNLLSLARAIDSPWEPRPAAAVGDYRLKVALAGEAMPWHAHEGEDELFLVLEGELLLDLESGETLRVGAGEFHLVPRGTRHRPRSEGPCRFALFEPASTRRLGDLRDPAEDFAPEAFVSGGRVRIPEGRLEALRRKLAATDYAAPLAREPWAGGVPPELLRSLVARWLRDFDWGRWEERVNRHRHGSARLGDHSLHYVEVGRDRPGVRTLPVLLLHGWPGSFLELLPLAERLAGLEAEVSFTAIVPSLPGFAFSGLPAAPLTRERIAEDLHALMESLGHPRYLAFGGDIGGGAAGWIGARRPEALLGALLFHPPLPSSRDGLDPAERDYLARLEAYDEGDGGYSEIMLTRPDTIAAALQDSPAGLLAWMLDKYHDWSDPAGPLAPGPDFDADFLLATATLYWTTGTIASSFAQYFAWNANPVRPPVRSPIGVRLSREEAVRGLPESLARKAAPNILSWEVAARGGHFMGYEDPEGSAEAILRFAALAGLL